jgi:glutathione S-transferase
MLWALQQSDPLGWLRQSPESLQDALQCIAENDGAFKHHLDRYKYPHRYGLTDGTQHRTECAVLLKQLDQRLRHSPTLAAGHWGLLDAAVAPFVRQFAHTDMPWFAAQDWSALALWLRDFEASVAFGDIMDKVPPWTAGDTAVRTRFAG